MSLAKIAQHVELPQEGQIVLIPQISIEEDDDDFEPVVPLNFDEEHEHKHDHKKDDKDEGKGEVIVKIDEDDGEEDEVHMDGFAFLLPLVPGGENQDNIEEEEDTNDLAVEEDDEEIKVEEVDEWNWEHGGLKNFLSWLNVKLKSVPSHSGTDTSGLERAIAYLDSLDRIISKAVRKDIKNELDIGKIENAREEIRKGIVRLEDRLDKVNVNRYKKKRKKADEDQDSIVKEAQKIAGISGIVVSVPILISHCARICINAAVSHGRDIEDTFNKLAEKYKLTLREKTETRRVLSDMGYYVKDLEGDFDKDFDPSSEDNLNFSPNYPA